MSGLPWPSVCSGVPRVRIFTRQLSFLFSSSLLLIFSSHLFSSLLFSSLLFSSLPSYDCGYSFGCCLLFAFFFFISVEPLYDTSETKESLKEVRGRGGERGESEREGGERERERDRKSLESKVFKKRDKKCIREERPRGTDGDVMMAAMVVRGELLCCAL